MFKPDKSKFKKNIKFSGFKESKKIEVVNKKINDPDKSFFFNPIVFKWGFIELKRISELKTIPTTGNAVRILCVRNVNTIDVLNAFHGIQELSCTFATIDDKSVAELNKYNLKYLVARSDPKDENKFFNPNFENVKAEQKYKITSHLKIFLIKTKESYYVVNTSSNPKGSSQFETYTIYNNKDYYDFLLNSLLDISNKVSQECKYSIKESFDFSYYLNKGGLTPIDSMLDICKKEIVEQIDFVVFSTGTKALARLDKLNDNIKVSFHVSDFVIKMGSQKKVLHKIKQLTKKHSGNIDVYNTHCKLILIRTKSSHYIIDSTSNLGSNSKFEITEIRKSKKEYIFTIDFINKYFKEWQGEKET